MNRTLLKLAVLVFTAISFAGCTFVLQKGRRSDMEKIEDLSRQLDELSAAKRLLEDRLAQEINDDQVNMKMTDRGLVITVVADLIFDSGKAKIRTEAYPLLNKVARVLKENVSEYKVGIEGHTDNVPIKVSGWKSNWELSTARSLAVLHYLVGEQGIEPGRLSANGYGEYQPVASNATARGRQLNRRVEIVVFPEVQKVKGMEAAPAASEGTEPAGVIK